MSSRSTRLANGEPLSSSWSRCRRARTAEDTHAEDTTSPLDRLRLSVGSFVELALDITDGTLVEMLVPVEAQKGPYTDVDVVADR
jgi:hypothetical protein